MEIQQVVTSRVRVIYHCYLLQGYSSKDLGRLWIFGALAEVEDADTLEYHWQWMIWDRGQKTVPSCLIQQL